MPLRLCTYPSLRIRPYVSVAAQPASRTVPQCCILSGRARSLAPAPALTNPAPTKMDTTLLSAASSRSSVDD
jgi:hypothetical protein